MSLLETGIIEEDDEDSSSIAMSESSLVGADSASNKASEEDDEEFEEYLDDTTKQVLQGMEELDTIMNDEGGHNKRTLEETVRKGRNRKKGTSNKARSSSGKQSK